MALVFGHWFEAETRQKAASREAGTPVRPCRPPTPRVCGSAGVSRCGCREHTAEKS